METQTTPIGAWVKDARENAVGGKLSHDKLAAKVGTSRQHLIKLEKGMHKPGREMIARIAEATGKPAPPASDEDEAGRALPMRLDDELLLRAIAAALENAADSLRHRDANDQVVAA